jgi:23S rRNA (uracil1939-C5)-methyltransferase
MAVFVDRVSARIVKKKKSHPEALVLDLIESSAHRIQAPCPYSGICSGCKWQYLDYEQHY